MSPLLVPGVGKLCIGKISVPTPHWCQMWDWESYALERLVFPLVPDVGKLCTGKISESLVSPWCQRWESYTKIGNVLIVVPLDYVFNVNNTYSVCVLCVTPMTPTLTLLQYRPKNTLTLVTGWKGV